MMVNFLKDVSFEDVCCIIACEIGLKYVRFPQAETGMIEKTAELKEKYSIYQAFECTDGAHVIHALHTVDLKDQKA